jgi:hypothetical protein
MAGDWHSRVRRLGIDLFEKCDGQNSTIEMENDPVLVVGGFLHSARGREVRARVLGRFTERNPTGLNV